jgi:chromosome segregation ATPase
LFTSAPISPSTADKLRRFNDLADAVQAKQDELTDEMRKHHQEVVVYEFEVVQLLSHVVKHQSEVTRHRNEMARVEVELSKLRQEFLCTEKHLLDLQHGSVEVGSSVLSSKRA